MSSAEVPGTSESAVAQEAQRITWSEIWHVYKRFWVYVRPYRRKFFLALVMVLLAVPLAQLSLFLTRDVTNQALLATNLTVDERWATVIRIVGLQAIFFLASAILSTWREVFEWYCGMKSTFDLRLKFYRHLHRLPLSFLTRRTPGEHLYRSTTDMVSMFRTTSEGIPPVVSATDSFAMFRYNSSSVALAIYSNDVDPFDPGIMGMIVRTGPLLLETVYTLAWTVALLSILDPLLGLFLVFYIIPFTWASHKMYSKVQQTAFTFKGRSEFEAGVLRDSIAGIRTLKVFGRLAHQAKNFYNAASTTRRFGIKQAWELVQTQNIVQSGLKWTFGTLMFVYVSSQVIRGQATIGDWLATFILLAAAQLPLEKFVQLSQLIRMQTVPAKRVAETMEVDPTLEDKPGAHAMPPISGEIQFKDVKFSYHRDVPVLKGIDLTVKPGEYVGIVGPSGAGKSSLVNLILRLYPVDSGEVLVDGHNVRDVKLQSLLDQTAVVPQMTFLYSGTIRDNILFGNPHATDEQIERSVDLAGLRSFIDRLENGMETEVGEGATISGGERQRIGIARALVREPRIVILDEATASLDPETEEHILETVDSLRAGMTIVAIAHRLKAVVHCDRIVALKDGEIDQIGSHQELLETDGLYAQLWEEQMRDWSPASEEEKQP